MRNHGRSDRPAQKAHGSEIHIRKHNGIGIRQHRLQNRNSEKGTISEGTRYRVNPISDIFLLFSENQIKNPDGYELDYRNR